MLKAEFGIIDEINAEKDYSDYEPLKYHCIAIDDDIYINDWWEQLTQIKTYFHCLNRPEMALARWGVTLIPPESLPLLLKIIVKDLRILTDKSLTDLKELIERAIIENKFIIHFGV